MDCKESNMTEHGLLRKRMLTDTVSDVFMIQQAIAPDCSHDSAWWRERERRARKTSRGPHLELAPLLLTNSTGEGKSQGFRGNGPFC